MRVGLTLVGDSDKEKWRTTTLKDARGRDAERFVLRNLQHTFCGGLVSRGEEAVQSLKRGGVVRTQVSRRFGLTQSSGTVSISDLDGKHEKEFLLGFLWLP